MSVIRPTDVVPAAETLLAALTRYRMPVQHESDLQLTIGLVLEGVGYDGAFEREYDLGAAGRIDFYFPSWRIGLEVKVGGSAASVLRQLHRYAESPAIAVLCLVTTRVRHRDVPRSLLGKPVLVHWIGADQV
jgi:hypothetical protein